MPIFAQQKTDTIKVNKLEVIKNVIVNSVVTVPEDFVQIGKQFTNNVPKTLLYTGIVGATVVLDKPITTLYQDEIETRIDYQLPNIAINNNQKPWISGNDAYMTYAMAGVYGGSLITGYEKGQYAAVNGLKALSYSILTTQLVFKTIFGRARPYESLSENYAGDPSKSKNPLSFGNSRGGDLLKPNAQGSAFPSLHATSYFAMAKVFQMEFDNYWIPYGFMSAIFLADINSHNHWVGDMLAGGIVGTVIGRGIVKSSWKKRGLLANKPTSKVAFTYIPEFTSQYSGLRVIGNF